MPAYVVNKLWTLPVPYEFEDGRENQLWIVNKINEFNGNFLMPFFSPRTNQDDYVVIGKGSNSPIGKQGGKQLLNITTAVESQKKGRSGYGNLYHEMGHCLGLGHTYFNTGCRDFTNMFAGVNQESFERSPHAYTDYGHAYCDSMMVYHPRVFKSSPRISRIVNATGNNRLFLPKLMKDLLKLADLYDELKTADLKKKFSMGAAIPAQFKKNNNLFINKGETVYKKIKLQSCNDLENLSGDDLVEFYVDCNHIAKYWIFDDEGQNMNLTAVDISTLKGIY